MLPCCRHNIVPVTELAASWLHTAYFPLRPRGLCESQAPRKPQERPRPLPITAASPRKAPGALGGASASAAAGREPSGGEPSMPGVAAQSAEGATVFVRGLPLDASQFALQDRMARFGRVQACRWADYCLRPCDLIYLCICMWQRVCVACGTRWQHTPSHPMLLPECVGGPGRLVLDKQTRKPKGTAFVEFEAPAAAQKAATACAKARCAPFATQDGRDILPYYAASACGPVWLVCSAAWRWNAATMPGVRL